MDYPIRINKYLSEMQYCSRRAADKLIEQGKVKVNGKPAVIGQKVHEKDKVEVEAPEVKKIARERVYLVYHKPAGLDSHAIKLPQYNNLFPIGRLDKNSRGLMVLTNDGRVTDRMLNPKYDHEKEYSVTVDKVLRPGFLEKARTGMTIDDYTTKPAKVSKTGERKFKIILTEGRHHQIRRMADAFGYTVRSLVRDRIMNLKLTGLSQGQSRKLTGPELNKFLSTLGLKN
jgi:23S rRNA pseudouridine2604 synthase